MLELPSVTLIAVSSIKIEETIFALRYSTENIGFGDVKLVSHIKPKNLPSNIKLEYCQELKNINDFNHYMIYDLHKNIETEHCLVIHYDSCVLRPEKWQNRFLEYDYIGAPWPISNNAYISPFNEHVRVGNGGFSLRSRKLLLVPTKEEIPWEVNTGNFYKHMNAGLYSEDGNICVHNRHLFEKHGCKFAPIEIAVHFSQEIQIPETENIFSFGFHKYMK